MIVFETNFKNLGSLKRGKVRDIYDLGDKLLIIATDRISAFDVILNEPIPNKGKVLNQISIFWFNQMKDIVKNHIISTEPKDYPKECKPYIKELEGRSMLVQKAKPLPIECVVRGYISGSGWKSYQKDETICGIKLPSGLKQSEKLQEPIFTPSTKAEIGSHDENISFEEAIKIIGREKAEKVKNISIEIYKKGRDIADKSGLIIADTKFEFGIINDKIILIDEVLTPDSSRFWDKAKYKVGISPESFDKQYLRDYLEEIKWDKKPPAPKLPDKIIQNTAKKYDECFNLLTKKSLKTNV